MIFLVALRVPSTCPSASRPLRSRRRIVLATMSRCSAHSFLVGISPGAGMPKPVPWIRAIVNTCTLAPADLASSTVRATAAGGIGRPSEASRIRRKAV